MKDKLILAMSCLFVALSMIGISTNYLIHSMIAPFKLGTILILHDMSTAVFNIGAIYCIIFVMRWIIFDKLILKK